METLNKLNEEIRKREERRDRRVPGAKKILEKKGCRICLEVLKKNRISRDDGMRF